MHLQRLTLGILLFATLHVISAKDEEEDSYDSEFPCKLFAQTCLDLCAENDADVTNFSASCDAETSSCKCNDDELTPNVFKKSKELYHDNMELQVEEQNGDVSPVKFFNLVLEQDAEYDELSEEDEDQVYQPQNNIKKGGILKAVIEKKLDLKENGDGDKKIIHESELDLRYESKIFCPAFIKRCMDDCPATSSRPNCGLDIKTTGYLLECECNGVDISNSVRNQVLAEIFHAPA